MFDQTVRPFLARYCLQCHSAKVRTANLDLEAYRNAASATKDTAVWEQVLTKLRTGQMPPKPMPRPSAAEIAAVTRWIDGALAAASPAKPEPGRLTAHRLNRFEYNNTVHDLLAVDFRPADDFPADDSGYGFDNIGDVLSLSPVLMEKYLNAAEKIARLAIAADPPLKPTLERHRADKLDQVGPELALRHRFPVEGDYDLRFNLTGRRPKKVPQHLVVDLSLDGQPLRHFDVSVEEDKPRIFEERFHIHAGERALKVEVIKDEPLPETLPPNVPNQVQVDYLEIRGPYNQVAPPPPESHKRVFVCGHANGHHTEACGRQIVANLARRAWRRPVSEREVDQLLSFVEMARKQGDSFEQGIRVALQAILVSPHFLFRIERDPPSTEPGSVRAVSPFEMASRLSYFLWSSMPDEELLQAAADGSFTDARKLDAQVLRMLRDPRSRRLVVNFAGQWLELRNLDSVRPDPERFPGFDDRLRAAMRQETILFFDSIVREDRSILDFIDGPYTFLNERLARFYGIPGIEGDEFRRVALTGGERSGVLTQASVLTVTSYPNRTSPVLRGKFLLENILNAPPPPPPPDAGSLDESQVNVAGTVREQFEKHRSQATCAACHARMDPLGFAFENYDAIGKWRTHEGRFPVDPSGVLPDGHAFRGAAELKSILKTQKDAFARCLTEKMLTYALGRGLERYDRPAVDQICRRMAEEEYRFSSLVLGIVHSLPFEMRRVDPGRPTPDSVAAAGHTPRRGT